MKDCAGREALQFGQLAFGRFAGGEHFNGFLDAIEAGLRLFRALDPVGIFLFVRVGESGEGFFLGGIFHQCGFEVCGNGDGARSVIVSEFDLNGVAGVCSCAGENVFAHAENVNAGAGHERVAEGESVDGGADGDLALAAKDFRDAEGDFEVGPGAAGTAADELGLELERIRLGFGHGRFLRTLWRNLNGILP